MATKKSGKPAKRGLKKGKKLTATKTLAVNAYVKLGGIKGE
jgi:hypothetical protein